MASSVLKKVFSSDGNRRTMTISFWMKRTVIELLEHALMGTGSDGNVNSSIRFEANGTLKIFDYNGQAGQWIVTTQRKFLDATSWYHFVFVLDSTQSTDSERVRIYVNGVREPVNTLSSPTWPNQNTDFNWNSAAQSWAIGCQRYGGNNSKFFNGYLAHINFIDGSVALPAVFGEADSTTGEWKPKLNPTVTYGSQGFFLKFNDPSALGDDSSGNNHDFAITGNFRQSYDTPNNNFCTLDDLQAYQTSTDVSRTTYAGTAYLGTGSTARGIPGTQMMSAGKWYAEFKPESSSTGTKHVTISIVKNGTYASSFYRTTGDAAIPGNSTSSNGCEGISYQPMMGTPKLLDAGGGGTTNYGVQASANDIIMMAVDLSAATSKIWFGKNGTWFNAPGTSNVGVPHTGANPGLSFAKGDDYWGPHVTSSNDGADKNMFCNFGNGYFGATAVSSGNADDNGVGIFEYDVPAGFYAICTKNLKDYG